MEALNPQQSQAYLNHLELPAPGVADRANLDRLIAAQLARVPFENVNVLLDRPVRLDADALFAKVVEGGRGGYCFEINSLFARLLLALDYRVSLLAGRVRWGLAADAPQTMLSHLLLRVELPEGAFIVDIGFGAPTPFRAMPLVGRDGLGDFPFRLQAPTQAGGPHALETRAGDDWAPVYHFDLAPQPWVDYIARNWYTATHPDSVFRQMLMAARTEGSTRLTLGNGSFSRRHADGRVEQQRLASAAELVELLRGEFRLNLDPERDGEPLRRRLEGILQAQ
ncbi:MAG: arylamine N-acetyltransferase family protein [Pseudomonas sp.]